MKMGKGVTLSADELKNLEIALRSGLANSASKAEHRSMSKIGSYFD